MKKRQKSMLIEIGFVVAITVLAVLAMVNFKDYINKSEAIKSMNDLSNIVKNHKEKYGIIPPELYVQQIKDTLQGSLRLGGLQYRARWIDFDSPPETILAYTEKNFRSPFVKSGYVVLKLNGKVIWMGKKEFELLLKTQQKPQEIEFLKKELF